MKIFKKKRFENGLRKIYLCNICIWRYYRPVVPKIDYHRLLKYCHPERQNIILREMFFDRTGKLPNEQLETFNEKLLWLAMFDRNPLRTQCADKFAVREYVSENIGDKYLPKLYDVLTCGSDFHVENYPDRFVLSYNAGSGENIVVKNKATLNITKTKKIINKWLLTNHAWNHGEMQYFDVPPRVIVREYLDMNTDIEYKCFCFDGRVEFIQAISYKNGHNDIGTAHYDRNWNLLKFTRSDLGLYEINRVLEKPTFLDDLIRLSEKLAAAFPFARIDFYETASGELKFGEITFTPTSAQIEFAPDNDKWQKYFGSKINIPLDTKCQK